MGLDDHVRHSFVAAIGQRTTRFCMDSVPFVQSAHTDSDQMQIRTHWNQDLVVRRRAGIDDAGRREQARQQPDLGLATQPLDASVSCRRVIDVAGPNGSTRSTH